MHTSCLSCCAHRLFFSLFDLKGYSFNHSNPSLLPVSSHYRVIFMLSVQFLDPYFLPIQHLRSWPSFSSLLPHFFFFFPSRLMPSEVAGTGRRSCKFTQLHTSLTGERGALKIAQTAIGERGSKW